VNAAYYQTLLNDANFQAMLAKYEEFLAVNAATAQDQARKFFVEDCGWTDREAISWVETVVEYRAFDPNAQTVAPVEATTATPPPDEDAFEDAFAPTSSEQTEQAEQTEQQQGEEPQAEQQQVEQPQAEEPSALNAPVVESTREANVSFFESIAMPLIGRGFKVAPCFPHYAVDHDGTTLGKTVDLPDPLNQRSNDPAQIHAWGLAKPHANVCVYAVQENGGVCFIDKDGAVSLVEKYERETGKQFPKTLLVCSSVTDTTTKGHWYFYQTPKTIALAGNIGEEKTGGLFSFRVKNQYVTSIGSIHPATKKPYAIFNDVPIIPIPDDFVDWLYTNVVKEKSKTAEDMQQVKLAKGTRYPALISYLGKLWAAGTPREAVITAGLAWAEEHFDLPEGSFNTKLVQGEIEHYLDHGYERGQPVPPMTMSGQQILMKPDLAPTVPAAIDTDGETVIPSFDPSVMNGIYKKIVDLVTRGTTMCPQFTYLIAKTLVGARMAMTGIRFENMDVEPRFYAALIGETGSGKGESWRRVRKILESGVMKGADAKANLAAIKIIDSADSGAGIRDLFFDKPQDEPVLMYIDEIAGFGNKTKGTKQPELLDRLIELADSTNISVVKAKKGKKPSTMSHDHARLVAVLCGQSGEVYMEAFAGKSKVGLWDRFTPEFSVPVEGGDLPEINLNEAIRLMAEFNTLFTHAFTMTMAPDAEQFLKAFWATQPAGIKSKVRWRRDVWIDAYMSAFGRGSKVAELADAEIAVKIFCRQIIIRQEHFAEEVPDRAAYFLSKIKKITAAMRKKLKAGVHPSVVALSRRDYERLTNATRDNEELIFARAWDNHVKTHLELVLIQKTNGHSYEKYIPKDHDDGDDDAPVAGPAGGATVPTEVADDGPERTTFGTAPEPIES
jgi:hypothetical protein